MVELVKICTVCGKNLGTQSCMNCGALVCGNCFSTKRQLCASCIAGKT